MLVNIQIFSLQFYLYGCHYLCLNWVCLVHIDIIFLGFMFVIMTWVPLLQTGGSYIVVFKHYNMGPTHSGRYTQSLWFSKHNNIDLGPAHASQRPPIPAIPDPLKILQLLFLKEQNIGQTCDAFNTKKLSFKCPAMMASKNLDEVSKKQIFGQKKQQN